MKIDIAHHELIACHPYRWLVIHRRSEAIPVELPDGERSALDLDEDQIHALLPTAFLRRHESHPDDPAVEREHSADEGNWDSGRARLPDALHAVARHAPPGREKPGRGPDA